jgi:hypothetical protein
MPNPVNASSTARTVRATEKAGEAVEREGSMGVRWRELRRWREVGDGSGPLERQEFRHNSRQLLVGGLA